MADEKLILVERFEELKTGMRVVVKSCLQCKTDHRLAVLTKRVPVTNSLIAGKICFEHRPNCHPKAVISISTVAERRVFRPAADLDMERELARETAHDKPYVGPIVAAAMRMGLLPR